MLTPILAGGYGVIHDQITYSISPEYFTKFKFGQFGLWDYALEENNREKVAFIGVMATWWFGLIIGFVNGFIGLIQPNAKIMRKSVFGATILTIGVTAVFGFLGFLVGKFIIAHLDINWTVPVDIIELKSFLTVGTIHNFGYFGGIVGLIIGVIYQIRLKKSIQQ